jgi:uncharacterized protein (DUF1330 family)
MAAYIVVQIEIEDPVLYEQYRAVAPASIDAYGGRYLVRGGAVEQLEGTWSPRRLVILEFPTADRARAWWASTAYGPAKAIRQACARTEMILVEGVA